MAPWRAVRASGGFGRYMFTTSLNILRKVSEASSPTQEKNSDLQVAPSTQYCMDLVRKFDYENYLCILLLPHSIRSTAFAVRAFNVELAQIRDTVSDRTIGLMRLQFWKDSLEKIYAGHPPQTPVALELYQSVQNLSLSKLWLRRLIDAREESLYDKPFQNVETVEGYAEKAVTPVFYLLLEAAGIKDVNADHVASHLGKAIGISTLIRSVPYHIGRGRVLLPIDLLIQTNLSAEVVSRIARSLLKADSIPITETEVSALKEVVFLLASKAHRHLETSKSLLNKIPSKSHHIFLPIVPCQTFLDRLRKNQFDVFHPGNHRRNGMLGVKLWVKAHGIFGIRF